GAFERGPVPHRVRPFTRRSQDQLSRSARPVTRSTRMRPPRARAVDRGARKAVICSLHASMNRLNHFTLMIFAPILIATGAMGLATQSGTGPMSDAFAYDVFHIVFGLVGLSFVLLKRVELVRTFNIGFGAIDLYQLAASLLGIFPAAYFRW